jgi:ArsR family transcriptional regulator, arsenate/arsenite/antimonite-responsive transcriptional repressor
VKPSKRTLSVTAASTGCCSTLPLALRNADEVQRLAASFSALADPARLHLISLIANAPAGEACACDLIEPIGKSQPTVSHHLKVLTEAELILREKRGVWAWYRINPERVEALRNALG